MDSAHEECGQFIPIAWLSKKQTPVSRSTTEAEVIALSYVLFEEAIDPSARQNG